MTDLAGVPQNTPRRHIVDPERSLASQVTKVCDMPYVTLPVGDSRQTQASTPTRHAFLSWSLCFKGLRRPSKKSKDRPFPTAHL